MWQKIGDVFVEGGTITIVDGPPGLTFPAGQGDGVYSVWGQYGENNKLLQAVIDFTQQSTEYYGSLVMMTDEHIDRPWVLKQKRS